MYGSPVALEFTSVYFMLLNYWTLVASNEIAQEKGETFANFERSAYADGSYFDKYLTKDWGRSLQCLPPRRGTERLDLLHWGLHV